MEELVLNLEEIPDGGVVRRTLGPHEVAIFRKGADVYAIDAVCPHRRGPLDEATFENEFVVMCPWHGWRFDIRTGLSPDQPARVMCYRVQQENGRVHITRPN